MKKEISTLINEYFPEYDSWLDTRVTLHPVWVAVIGNEEIEREIIDDDGRPGFEEKSWLRLKSLIESTDLFIKRFYVRWRRKKILAAENMPYLFFARCIQGDWPTGQNFNFFLTGTGNEKIMVRKWELPTLGEVLREIRLFEETKPEFIIWNNTSTNPVTLTRK